MKTMNYPQTTDYQIGFGNQILLKKDKVVPLEALKSLVNCFDIDVRDLSKVLDFLENLKNQKKFFRRNKSKFKLLTPKELEIFLLVADGLSTQQISEKLFIEKTTVSTHRKHIKSKLELQSSHDWFIYANAYKNTYL